MENASKIAIRELLARIARIQSAQGWDGEINPSQRAALDYLARANRFSRAPSHVADYLSATRGTISQTLKALARKGLVIEQKSATDKRSIQYQLTEAGLAALAGGDELDQSIDALGADAMQQLERNLSQLVRVVLARRGGRSFGICHTCRHYLQGAGEARCALLKVALTPADSKLICHEHTVAA